MVKPTPPVSSAQRPRSAWASGWGAAVVLLVLLIWVSSALVLVENERYALAVGMCKSDPVSLMSLPNCLAKTQTRTGWWWHLYYALLE